MPLRSAETSQIVTLPPILELFDPNFLDVLIPPIQDTPISKGESTEVASNAMMDALRFTAHRKLTTNDAPAYSSTLAPTLDAWLFLGDGVSGEGVDEYFEKAWAEDPNLTLRIMWSMRSIHDGKGEKELFYLAFGWLFENHPRTAITNLHCLVDPVCLTSGKDAKLGSETGGSHGNWKDLLDVLALATSDELRTKFTFNRRPNFLHNHCSRMSRPTFQNNQEQEEWSRGQRAERFRRAHERLTQKLLDNRYRALYIAVARLFADQLAKDHGVMDKIDALPANANREDRMALSHALTFVSKWAPTPGGSHDRVTNISSAICLLLHEAQASWPAAPKITFSAGTGLPASDMHLLRYFYQKYILTRGRRLTCIPESLMSTNRWSEITYSRVASHCMNKNKVKFFVHDEARFMNYLQDVESGKSRISGATLFPHLLAIEAVRTYRQGQPVDAADLSIEAERTYRQGKPVDAAKRSLANVLRERKRRLAEAQIRVVDAQWAMLLARLRESGRLDNSIAVCDVSGSMGSIDVIPTSSPWFHVSPIWPAVSLSILVARLAKAPFNDSFITFSASPEFVTIEPESKHVPLGAIIDSMSQAGWGQNTDFSAVFLKLILPLAVAHKVPKDQMIKRIFVFSDMQFDVAGGLDEGPSSRSESDPASSEGDGASGDSGFDPASNYGEGPSSGSESDVASNEDEGTGSEGLAAEWKTNHDVIAEAYAKAGYDVPELVYWNLWNPGYLDVSVPATSDRQGVALVSGYSPSLLKVYIGEEILGDEGQLTGEEQMKKALGIKSYDGLVVVD